MQRIAFMLLILITFTASAVLAGDYRMRKKTADYTVDMTINRNPPIVAKNRLTLEIRDKSGNAITDAAVLVNYYMPPMPGMAPMNYTTAAQPAGGEYRMVMDLIMAGPWNIVVRITRSGKTVTARFAIDVN